MPGMHEPVMPGPYDLKTVRATFFGLPGESEIIGFRNGRNLECRHWLYGNYATPAALVADLQRMEGFVGSHGLLVMTAFDGATVEEFHNCTFLGFERELIDDVNYLLKDMAGTLDGGWFARGVLRWRQLR